MEKMGSLGQGGSGVADVEQPTMTRDLCRDFERFHCLALLPPQHRQAIDLRFFEQLTDRAAGEKIGTAPSTITKQARAAITQLRKLLSERGVEGTCLPKWLR